MYSNSIVGSTFDDRGVEIFYHIVGSVTKNHLGFSGVIVDPVFKDELGDLSVSLLT